MTKEEFINLAKESTDRIDMLGKMGQPFSLPNMYKHIRDNRIAFGITKEEFFALFKPSEMSKDTYLSYLSGSKNDYDVSEKMGHERSEINRIKYVMDIGNKLGVTKAERLAVYTSVLN